MKKDKYLPYKEKMRRYDYQFNQTDREDELMYKKEAKRLEKLKRQAMKGEKNL